MDLLLAEDDQGRGNDRDDVERKDHWPHWPSSGLWIYIRGNSRISPGALKHAEEHTLAEKQNLVKIKNTSPYFYLLVFVHV